ncbi:MULTISPECIES: ArsR/SmtB family transcription factor [Providencia]|uniref:HTH-type transcriptional regulator CmtR n=2 Tax=Providencia rettgeri TaxID=587 RepID=A0A9N8H3K2_PRORE|nr:MULTISPECIES: metalloregulator ArsR/SmtB family transcription factor [Providencia]MRF68640.1 metalloregulator ArsR/SmtB family transcription factor [Escherichia coli]EHZ6873378.1 helix-turn-helix transcriptional regulator [Providencia rettgeri]MBI6191512.1 helix-turn-helix transcriptional regulator [Providencia rettgeri]MBN7842796.1 helix-turn-helix transcriptional regulator [Providencia rettgeri]MBN7855264.1 helix-turn-helix transcriptional regulator [Providencia rettgeri]
MIPSKDSIPIEEKEPLEQSIAKVASAIADPSRVSILCALMDGRAWTATELSVAANIAPSTTSAHLTKLLNSHLISCLSQGRHRYYRLAGTDIAELLETLMGVSMKLEYTPPITTPIHLRKARTCYDHLAGEIAVQIYEFMDKNGWFTARENKLSMIGANQFKKLGIDIDPNTKRKIACACLDWSERRMHLGGLAGTLLLKFFAEKEWIEKTKGYREITFTTYGKKALKRIFNINIA